MDEFSFADIDADMAECVPHGVEKYQITRPQVGTFYFLGNGSLLLGFAWQDQAHGLLKYGFDKTTAVKTTFYRIATAPIGYAEKTHGCDNQLGGIVTDRLSHLVDSRQQTFVAQELLQLVAPRGRNGIGVDAQPEDDKEGSHSHGA